MKKKDIVSVTFIGLLLALEYSSIILNKYYDKWYLANYNALMYVEFIILVLLYQFSSQKKYITFTISFCLIFTLNYLSFIEQVDGIESAIVKHLSSLNISLIIRDYDLYYRLYNCLIYATIIGTITEILYKKKVK